ncbi:hypothetical protein BRC88_09765 [Halobacteriales archaeon QS_4_69_225]|nr:MAG: hypothetical protein BRC88_09765 [Halobacteriales archaeon QS_4_69_225]
MTRTTDTTATDAQRGDQLPGRTSPQADADGPAAERPETAAGREDADRQHRERSVVVGGDGGGRATIRGGAVETPPATEAVGTVKIPAAASPAEADAIAAAIEEHLDATEAAPASGTDRWAAAGRVREVVADPRPALDGAGSDPWIAASRAQDRR